MKKKNGLSFFSLIITLLVFNIFVSIASNSYFINKRLGNNYFFTIELQNGKTKESIQNFERMLLMNRDIKSVKYVSKDDAFKELQDELEIVIPHNENPIPNTIIVNFDDMKKLKIVGDALDVNPMIRNIYIDEEFFKMNSKRMQVSQMIFILFSVLAFVLISTIIINLRYIMLTQGQVVKTVFFYILSSIIGVLGFLNLYSVLTDKIINIFPQVLFLSFIQTIFFIGVGNILILFFFIFNTNSNRDGA